MRTALDVDPSKLDAQERRFVENIREHGWSGTHVMPDENGPGFSYSTRFFQRFGAPEVLVFSFPRDTAHAVLWQVHSLLEEGQRFSAQRPVHGVLNGYEVIFGTIPKTRYREYIGWSLWFYGGPAFECFQMFTPDKAGAFRWSRHASIDFQIAQPDLTDLDWGRSDERGAQID